MWIIDGVTHSGDNRSTGGKFCPSVALLTGILTLSGLESSQYLSDERLTSSRLSHETASSTKLEAARPGRKQATETEGFEFRISYLHVQS
jgi:hypothetical protein